VRRSKPVDQESSSEQYHNSEKGDIYDLYNACNGAMLGGLLDPGKLDALSERERAELDVARLRQVWEHTASGCTTCAQIVRRLNLARKALRERL
jgi:hypothetical protein